MQRRIFTKPNIQSYKRLNLAMIGVGATNTKKELARSHPLDSIKWRRQPCGVGEFIESIPDSQRRSLQQYHPGRGHLDDPPRLRGWLAAALQEAQFRMSHSPTNRRLDSVSGLYNNIGFNGSGPHHRWRVKRPCQVRVRTAVA